MSKHEEFLLTQINTWNTSSCIYTNKNSYTNSWGYCPNFLKFYMKLTFSAQTEPDPQFNYINLCLLISGKCTFFTFRNFPMLICFSGERLFFIILLFLHVAFPSPSKHFAHSNIYKNHDVLMLFVMLTPQ